MKIKIISWFAAAIALLAVGAGTQVVRAHDSNTLDKMGRAIAYPVKKAGQNLSIATHKAVGHKSVEHSTENKRKYVISPGGRKFIIHKHHRYIRHRRIHRYVRRS